MPKIKRKDVNIYAYPETVTIHSFKSVITFPDLDANAAKFMFMLIREGLVTLPEEEYEKFIKIYWTDELTKEQCQNLDKILSEMKLNSPTRLLQIGGDDFADRGKHDWIIAKIYMRLIELDLKFIVLASNHGFQFLRQFYSNIDNPKCIIYYTNQYEHFGRSLHNLRKSIREGIISKGEIDEFIIRHYLPKLQLLNYIPNNNPDQPFILYSHAPLHNGKLKSVAQLFRVEHSETQEGFSKMIDEINRKFQRCLFISKNIKGLFFDKRNFKFMANFVTDRYSDLHEQLERKKHNNTALLVHNYHCHVGDEKLFSETQKGNWEYFNTDGTLGKSDMLYRGNYKISVNPYPTLEPTLEPTLHTNSQTTSISIANHPNLFFATETKQPRSEEDNTDDSNPQTSPFIRKD